MNTIFLALHTRNLGTETRELMDPFTGARVTAHVDTGMTMAERLESAKLLKEVGASEPDPEGFRRVEFPTGSYLSICQGSLGAQISVTGDLTIEAVEFIFRLALASGMLVTSSIDPDVVAVLPGQSGPCIDNRWPSATPVASADMLKSWIETEVAHGRIA